MKKSILITLITLFTTVAQAQQWQWAKPLNKKWVSSINQNWEQTNTLKTDANGNVYVTGWFEDTAYFSPTVYKYASVKNGFLAKYNANGTLQWVKHFSSGAHNRGTALAIDNSGNCFLTIFFNGNTNINIDGTIYSPTYQSTILVEFSPQGNKIASHLFSNLQTYLEPRDIVVYNNKVIVAGIKAGLDVNGLYMNGSYIDTLRGNIFLLAIDWPSQNYLWVRDIMTGTSNQTDPKLGLDMDVNNLGDVYITATYTGTLNFNFPFTPFLNNNNGYNKGGYDHFVAKYDHLGNYYWTTNIGGTGDDIGTSIKVDGQNNIYVCGEVSGLVNFNTERNASEWLLSSGNSGYVAKLRPLDGKAIWVNRVGGTLINRVKSLSIKPNGNPILAGYLWPNNGSVSFGSLSIDLSNYGSESIPFSAELDPTGNFIEVDTIGGKSYSEIYAVTVDLNGNLYYKGFLANSNTGDTVTLGMIPIDFANVYLLKKGTGIAPVANFSSSVTTGTLPLKVNFTDLSTNTPLQWLWDFGDGTTSTLQNPQHTYTTQGTYSVSLTVTNANGSNTKTSSNLIVAQIPFINIDFLPNTVNLCNGQSYPLNPIITFNVDTIGKPFYFDWVENGWLVLNNNSIKNPIVTSASSVPSSLTLTVIHYNDTVQTIDTATIFFNPSPNTTITGTARQTNNATVVNSKVLLIAHNTINQTLTAIDSVVTDANGNYSLSVTPGTYYLKLIPNLVAYPNLLPTYYNISTVFQFATPIVTTSCNNRVINITPINGVNPGGSGFISGFIANGAGKTEWVYSGCKFTISAL
jgi:PKD repeat protein